MRNFYNFDVLGGKLISEEAFQMNWNAGVTASALATSACVKIWPTDFRADVARIDVPSLILHGDSDRIVPFEVSAQRLHEMLKDSELHVIPGAPHGMNWTHPEEINTRLIAFLDAHVRVTA